jgi:ssRNA-specific RNase YbeY (16S rRNA maturation enzyme)
MNDVMLFEKEVANTFQRGQYDATRTLSFEPVEQRAIWGESVLFPDVVVIYETIFCRAQEQHHQASSWL